MSTQNHPAPHMQVIEGGREKAGKNGRQETFASLAIRNMILRFAREEASTRVIARRLSISEEVVTMVIAEELEYALRVVPLIEALVSHKLTHGVREAIREAREGSHEIRIA